MRNKKMMRIIIVAASIFVIVLVMPYAKAELLTAKYGEEFTHEYKQSGMIEHIEYFKVISYNDRNASVFYVLGKHSAGVRINFVDKNGKWQLADWQVVWSASGSADSFCWPYYR